MEADEQMLKSVAKLSANGDGELADAVMRCFDVIGDDGNIIINEQSGPSAYEVEFTKGYPIGMGYEESCGKLFPLFLNDKKNNRTFLEKPVFLLYFGAITQIQTIEKLMQTVGSAWENPQHHDLEKPFNYNVVIVATGYSEAVLGDLSANFSHPHTINVFPLLTPKSPVSSGEMHFLYDLAAVTGATVFDPIGRPIENAPLQDLGYGIESFEATRYRSTILGLSDDTLIEVRADELRESLKTSDSKYDSSFIQERLAKLTSGIAKLKVIGPSNGELREKRDRAEDATFAVRGAKNHGCLPGGCWTLLKVSQNLPDNEINNEILIPALMEPLTKILTNCGMHTEEIDEIVHKLSNTDSLVYDAMQHQYVDARHSGILDSTPAVLEAVRNSISIASMLGTLGGSIVFRRDEQMELSEAQNAVEAEKSFLGD
jgi:chaperonin GroEL